MASKKKVKTAKPKTEAKPVLGVPEGYFGEFGGRFVSELLIPALDALHYVHRAGYVHRDLKPDNLFFHSDDRSERLIVLDLGIAKLARGEYVDKTTYHTESGRVLGTPAYMSPEQASGLPLDRRTDIYSIGVTLHRMLAGRLPFESEQGDRPLQLMARNIYDEPPRLDERALGLPSRLADVVLRTLAKAPGQRPAHMSELAEALSECLAEPDPRPATADFSRSGRVARVAGIAAGVAILGALVVSPGAGSPAGRALVVADEPHTSAAAPRPPALAVASQPAAPAVVETLAATAELVPAEARHRVRDAGGGAEADGALAEHRVARVVPEAARHSFVIPAERMAANMSAALLRGGPAKDQTPHIRAQ